MKLSRVTLLVALLAASAAAFAQVPPAPGGGPPAVRHSADMGRWWKNSEIVGDLQLTEAQINQIEQAFQEHRLKLIDLRAELERQEAKLQPLIEADRPDEAAVSAQVDLVLAARSKLEKANTMMMLAIRKALTVEQWKKLQAHRHERETRPHMMRPREPMRPGAPERMRPPQPQQPPQPPPKPPEV